MREAVRILTSHADTLQKGEATTVDGGFHQPMHEACDHRVAVLMEKMGEASRGECVRTGAWGVLGEGNISENGLD